MTILVTGGAGFIGANFVRYWRRARPTENVVILDKLTYAARPELVASLDGVELITGDICNTVLVRELLDTHAIDRLIHFAAESHVDRSISDPATFIHTNILGTQSLLDAAKCAWIDTGTGRPHRFHHISTDEVYGALDPGEPPFSEAHRFAPNSPYAATKAASDHLVRAWSRTYGMDVVVTNCSNNYGPLQHTEKLIPLCITRALAGEPIPIYGDGQQIRDWIHVEDHCRGVVAALESGEAGATYNLGGGEEHANIELIKMLCSAIDDAFEADESLRIRFPACPSATGGETRLLIEHVEDRPGHDRRYAIDGSKARTALDFSPAISLTCGLSSTLDFYLAGES